MDPTDVHYPMVQHILNDVDPGVLKTTLVNFFIYGISSCYTSVNWDAISSEAYFRQLIDLGCLFIWYFHYMPVGNDASPSRQPPRRRKSKKPPIEKAPSPGRETVLFACQKPMRAWEGGSAAGALGTACSVAVHAAADELAQHALGREQGGVDRLEALERRQDAADLRIALRTLGHGREQGRGVVFQDGHLARE